MIVVVAGSPTVVTPDTDPTFAPTKSLTQALSWRLTSWDGTAWELTDLSSPVLKLRGALGVGPVDPEHWWTDAPALDGSTWSGARTGRGEVFLPLMISGATSADFLANHAAFMRSLDHRRESTLRVTRPDGQWREIGLRYQGGANTAMDLDPVRWGQVTYGVTWATADPYWRGEPLEPDVFDYEVPQPFLVPPGPPIYLNNSRSLSSATITNPGDIDVPPLWRVGGPFTSFSVGVGDALVSMKLAKLAGEWVEIDMTRGQSRIVDEDGVNRWGATTARKFADIPPGDQVPVVTTVTGASGETSVSLSIVPKYRSAL